MHDSKLNDAEELPAPRFRITILDGPRCHPWHQQIIRMTPMEEHQAELGRSDLDFYYLIGAIIFCIGIFTFGFWGIL